MMDLEVLLHRSLDTIISYPDERAAETLNQRMGAISMIERIYEASYSERCVIVREFEKRKLWRYITDPSTGEPFQHMTAWLSCSEALGSRRINFEAKRDGELLSDVPAHKLIDVPKSNIKALIQLSTEVRNDPEILEAAKNLKRNEFLELIERDHPLQHLESKRVMRFSPDKSGADAIEEMIAFAIENGIAISRDEAIVMAAESALSEWKSDLPVGVE